MEDFTLSDNGDLFIRWNVNANYNKQSFHELVAGLIHEYKHTGGVYEAYVQNDGKLIGNDKIVIIRNMRDVIQYCVIIKNLLETKYVKTKQKIENLNIKFLDEYSFQLNYKYEMKEIQNIKSVKLWYDNYFKVEITSFINDLKKALEDKIITEEEALGLCKTLDTMLLGAAILYYKLSYENMLE